MVQQTSLKVPRAWEVLSFDKELNQIPTTNKKILAKSYLPAGKYPVVDQSQDFVAGYCDDVEKLIVVEKPVVVFGDHTRAIKYVDFDFVPGADGTKVLIPNEYFEPKYYYYLLRVTELPDKGYSRHFKYLKEANCLVAPIQEQKRIVKKLDSLLAQVESIQQRLNNLPDVIKRFRQSVLAAAVSGKLTEQWRERNKMQLNALGRLTDIDIIRKQEYVNQCKAAKEQSERKPRKPSGIDDKLHFNSDWKDEFLSDLTEGWVIKALGYIGQNNADSIVDGPFGASINVKTDYVEDGVPVIRINNIKPFSFVNSNLKYIGQEKFSELTRHNVIAGDILFGKVGTIGDASIYPEFMPEGMLSTTGCTRIRVDERIINRNYSLIYLNAMKSAFNRIASAAVQPFLNMKTVKSFPIPIPDIKEQTEIVRLVEQYFALADTLEKHLANAKARVDNLTQSILAKAFRGELVPQDPNDESADKLLERIKAARLEAEKLEKAAKKATKVKR